MDPINYITLIIFALAMVGVIILFRTYSIPNRLRKAEEFLQEGDINQSNEIVKRILEKRKDYVPARYLRAQILIHQGQYLLAISDLNAILAIPDFKKYINQVDIHYHLAFLYNETKNYTKEIDEYKIILSFNPEDVKANYRLGHSLFRQKDYKKVKELLTKAIVLDPTIKDCYLPLGVSCFHVADYGKAEEYLTLALKYQADHTETNFYLGQIFKMKKDHESAFKMFESSMNNSSFFLKSLFFIGEMCYEKDEFETAIEYLERGLKKLTDNSEDSHAYRYLLAECYEHENKVKEAIYHWEKIASENPAFRNTRVKLDSYREIINNPNLTMIFGSSLEELQPVIIELISSLNYNIIAKEKISQNEYIYKAFNIKRTNDPPLLINFNRTTREITEGQIIEFYKKISEEKCKNGIYIATSKFSLRAKSSAATKMIELYGSDYVTKTVEKILARKMK